MIVTVFFKEIFVLLGQYSKNITFHEKWFLRKSRLPHLLRSAMADVARLDGAGDSDGEIDGLPTAQRQSLPRALKEEVAAETQALSGYRPPVALGSGSYPCPCCVNREDGGEGGRREGGKEGGSRERGHKRRKMTIDSLGAPTKNV